jgi:hypothetical protein
MLGSSSGWRRYVLVVTLASGCAPTTGFEVTPGAGPPNGSTQGSREVVLGQVVRGTLAANGDADEYAVKVPAGTSINAVLEVPHRGSATQLRASVHRQHPVTNELTVATAVIVGSDDGEPGATEPVTPDRDAVLVVRVEGVDSRFGGGYVLHILPTTQREIRLGETVQGTLAGRGDTDDYTLRIDRPVRFNARLAAPHRGAGRLVEVQVYHRSSITGELRFIAGAITDSREGSAAATDPVPAAEAGTFVVRVHGLEAGGTYELTTEQL